MNVESGFQLDLLGTLRRRARLSLIIAGVMFLLSFWVAMALPNEYQSSATIFVEPQAISQELVRAGVESDLAHRLNLMTSQILSRPRLSRVIDELDLYENESKTMLREEVIQMMRDRIRIIPVVPEIESQRRSRDGPEINTFTIGFTADTPVRAAAVAQRLANDFIREHIEARVQVTQKSLEFIDSEQQRLSARIRAVESQIAQLKGENAGSLPEDLSTNYRLLERVLSELRAAQRDLDLGRSDLAFWENQSLAAASGGVGGGAATSSPVVKMQMLELQLSEYEAKGFTEKHPDVVRTTQEIEAIRTSLEATENEDGEEEAPMASLAQQSAEASKRRAEIRVQSTIKEIERIESQLAAVNEKIEATPRVAESLEGLSRDYKSLLSSLTDFSARRQQATVQVDLERRQLGEQFRILEPAYAAPEPSAPNRPLILVLGLMLGIVLGIATGIIAEGTDASYHVPRDLQTEVGIPVLVSIPEISLESDLLAARRKMVRTLAVASLVTLFTLTGGAATYMYVNGAPGFVSALFSGDEEGETPAVSAGATEGDRL